MIKNIFFALLLSLSLAGLTMADVESVDINTATAEQLADTLVGVGAARAEAIISYREEHGPFNHADELVNVRGIGLRTVDRNRDRIALEASDSD